MVAEMLPKSKFYHMFYIYVISFIIYLLYIHMYIICFLFMLYISIFILFDLNLCNNAFNFIICRRLLRCKILIIKNYLYFNNSNC